MPIKTIKADTKSNMLLAIKNDDFPKIWVIFFEVAKYLIFLDPAYRKNRVKKAKPVSRKIPIFPLENAWTEISTPERVINVPNIVDKNIKPPRK